MGAAAPSNGGLPRSSGGCRTGWVCPSGRWVQHAGPTSHRRSAWPANQAPGGRCDSRDGRHPGLAVLPGRGDQDARRPCCSSPSSSRPAARACPPARVPAPTDSVPPSRSGSGQRSGHDGHRRAAVGPGPDVPDDRNRAATCQRGSARDQRPGVLRAQPSAEPGPPGEAGLNAARRRPEPGGPDGVAVARDRMAEYGRLARSLDALAGRIQRLESRCSEAAAGRGARGPHRHRRLRRHRRPRRQRRDRRPVRAGPRLGRRRRRHRHRRVRRDVRAGSPRSAAGPPSTSSASGSAPASGWPTWSRRSPSPS